jgi:glycosyltransferase involved in cell wall biosynthesis
VTIIAQNDKNELAEGVKIIALPKPKNRLIRMTVTTTGIFLLALKQDSCIYHFHDPELILVGVIIKLLTGRKVVYDIHEDFPKAIFTKEWINPFLRGLIPSIFNFIEKRISLSFDYIIAATPNIAVQFKHPNVVIIANYPVLDFFPYIEAKRETVKSMKVIFCGTVVQNYGLREILKSLKFIPEEYNIQLRIVGKFYSRRFEREIKNIQGWEKVEFIGWIPHDRVSNYMIGFDCGLALYCPEPNSINAMPNKIFEYMAAGLPVIASNFPLWKKIIEGNECGICIDPLNPREIAKGIVYLADNPFKTKEMGVNARRIILEKFNWGRESEKLIRIYDLLTK